MKKNPLNVKEGEKLQLFLDREGISQYQLGEEIGKDQSIISKMVTGSVKIPTNLVKHLHLKYRLNYTWWFHTTGTMKVKSSEEKKSLQNTMDILATLGALMNKVDAMDGILKKVHNDFYNQLRNRDTTGTQN